MNPCLMNKKRIALLASNDLEPEKAQRLRKHLRVCPGCQQYWNDIQEVCREQTWAADYVPDFESDKLLHRRLKEQLARQTSGFLATQWIGMLSRRVAGWKLAVATVAIVLGFAFFPARKQSNVVPRVAGVAPNVSVTAPNMEPTMSAYRRALTRSFDEFDQFLNSYPTHPSISTDPVVMVSLARVPPNWPEAPRD
jgi:hypothetical protein